MEAARCDIMRIDTSGASKLTSSYDKLPYHGVKASHTMAQADLKEMGKYKSRINKVSREKGMNPALIAGIISRETRAGTGLVNGWGDHGNAWGLMQVDKNWHTVVGGWDSEEHLKQAMDILIYMLGEIKKKFSSWNCGQQLKGALAAYNKGPAVVQSYDQVDSGTTGRDYSNDVLARAQYYKQNGY